MLLVPYFKGILQPLKLNGKTKCTFNRYIETQSVKHHVLLIKCNLWQEKASNNLYLLHHFKIYHHIWHHNLLQVILLYQGLDMFPFCPKELVALSCTRETQKKKHKDQNMVLFLLELPSSNHNSMQNVTYLLILSFASLLKLQIKSSSNFIFSHWLLSFSPQKFNSVEEIIDFYKSVPITLIDGKDQSGNHREQCYLTHPFKSC